MDNSSIAFTPPAHGGQIRAISKDFSIPIERLLDFSASIYPDGPPASVVKTLSNALDQLETLRKYPDLESTELRSHLALYAGMPANNVIVGSGVVPLVAATIRALNVRRCLLPVPAFGEYGRILERECVKIATYRLPAERSFRPDLEETLEKCVKRDCDALILNNPHNPSGATVDADALRAFVGMAAQHGIRVLVDEAFIDFVPEQSLCSYVPQFKNLIVFRSVTKFFAMAGLRVAYLAASEEMLHVISGMLDPWCVSTLASLAANAAVQDSAYIARTLNRNAEERTWLTAALQDAGCGLFPGGANFILFRLPEEHRERYVWERLIVDHGIVVRNCATFEGLDDNYMRIAVRGREDNERLVRALSSLLNNGV